MSQIVCFGANTDGITVKASDSFLFNANLKYLFPVKSGKVCLCARTEVCVCAYSLCAMQYRLSSSVRLITVSPRRFLSSSFCFAPLPINCLKTRKKFYHLLMQSFSALSLTLQCLSQNKIVWYLLFVTLHLADKWEEM